MAAVIAWLSEPARAIRDAVAGLGDADLVEEGINHRGESHTIRWFIGTMIEHYRDHAREINHIRALSQRNDDA